MPSRFKSLLAQEIADANDIWRVREAQVTSVTCVARNDLLFTMSDNTRASFLYGSAAREFGFSRTRLLRARCDRQDRRTGGARRDRTDDLLLAKQALSQLSYGPVRCQYS